MNNLLNHFKNKQNNHSKKKIKGYMVFDSYEIYDCMGNWQAKFNVYINSKQSNKYIGVAIFK